MPADVVEKLTDELVALGKIGTVRTAMKKFGVVQTDLPGPAYAEALRMERASYASIIDMAGRGSLMLGTHLPCNTVVVPQNMPGAGGVGAAEISVTATNSTATRLRFRLATDWCAPSR